VLRKVVIEFNAPSIKRYDGGHCIARGNQANEDWWNTDKDNVHRGDISG